MRPWSHLGRHWSIFEALCRKSKTTGNLVRMHGSQRWRSSPDASGSASDRDYARFPGLNWRAPSEQRLACAVGNVAKVVTGR